MSFTRSVLRVALPLFAVFLGILFYNLGSWSFPAIESITSSTSAHAAPISPHVGSWSTWFHPSQFRLGTPPELKEWNLRHLGGNGPWIENDGDREALSLAPPEGYSIDQVHLMARHAERYPTKSAGNRHLKFLERVRDAGLSLNGSLAFLNNWTYFTDNPARDFGQLTNTGPYAGTLGAFTTGVRFRTRYGQLIPPDSTTRLWASDSGRVIDTARYFASGLFGLDWERSKKAELQIIPETAEQGADTLTPGDTCHKYLEDTEHGHDYGVNMLARFQEAYIPAIAERLTHQEGNAGLGRLTNLEVFSMQEMCGFETMVRGSSPWCDVFTEYDWHHFEYARDLIHYYRAGPGNPYAGAMGWLWLNATTALLRSGPKAGAFFLSFVHDGDIAPFLTALGLLSDLDNHLPTTHVATDRVWRTSPVLPMGARVTLERLTCSTSGEVYLRVNINDRVMPLSNCQSGPGKSCPLGEFEEYVRRRHQEVGEFGKYVIISRDPYPGERVFTKSFGALAFFPHSTTLGPRGISSVFRTVYFATAAFLLFLVIISRESRNPRRPPEETGPFGKRRNARYDNARSRTRTGTPAKRENPNVAEFGRLFSQQQEEEKVHGLPKSSSSSSLDNPRKQTEKVATECMLYGYKAKDFEWKVIDKYERISQGLICEDYPRSDPNSATQYAQLLSGGDVVIRANLSADANRKSKRYDGGFHWIKVTFDSTSSADRACFYSPQEIDGHMVYCELYHGHGPAEDTPIPADSAAPNKIRTKTSRTLTTSHSTAFLSSKDQDRLTLPRSFAMNNLSSVADVPETEEDLSMDSSTTTATSATATATGVSSSLDRSSSLHPRSVPTAEPKPESEFMTHIPTVRRTKLRPLAEALPPQPTLTERVLRSIPILSWFTGDIVGDGPQLREDGSFDYDKSNTYWRFWYMVDKVLGTDICGLNEES
ncbi:hypothetical protein NUU61_007389 [Penicillium alfredii]|uniref:3-phytase n=1 Tax=Penicillium alfredii TaxID=1506179 RepID=A0A9W9K496_9EURO|nr:uncharacterized protein NUU61_007389 [Penicillium alfredii]KAJ5092519.1 hypothetical protein NUU61_007389 [Penicillium alfredii]